MFRELPVDGLPRGGSLRALRLAVRLALLILVPVMLTACGTGGGAASRSETDPIIEAHGVVGHVFLANFERADFDHAVPADRGS